MNISGPTSLFCAKNNNGYFAGIIYIVCCYSELPCSCVVFQYKTAHIDNHVEQLNANATHAQVTSQDKLCAINMLKNIIIIILLSC